MGTQYLFLKGESPKRKNWVKGYKNFYDPWQITFQNICATLQCHHQCVKKGTHFTLAPLGVVLKFFSNLVLKNILTHSCFKFHFLDY